MTTTFTSARASGAVPVLGHIPALIRNPRKFLLSLPDLGDLVRIRLGPSAAFVLCNAELTDEMLANDRVFDKGGPLVDRLRDLIGDSVSTCPHSRHRRQRRLTQPAFEPNRFAGYASTMINETDSVISSWGDGEELDVVGATQAITTRISARTIFSASTSSALIEEAHGALSEILGDVGKRMLMPPPLDKVPIPTKLRYDRARTRLREVTGQLIADYRSMGVDHHDLISMLLSARDVDGDSLTDEEILNHVVTLFVGGFETVATTLAWAICVLAHHPEIQERLHSEVDSALGGRSPTLEDLAEMPYTCGVITESLRMYPPGWLLSRVATEDSSLGGVNIPAGSTVIYSPFLLGNHVKMFADPQRFDPDRWAEDGPASGRGALVPFGGGPRKCIGDAFTMFEAPIVLAMIASRWRLTPVNSEVRPLEHALDRMCFVLAPRKVRVRISKR